MARLIAALVILASAAMVAIMLIAIGPLFAIYG
jgi:hypothetical protein